MEKSILVQALQTLSRSEWRGLEKWLRSPAHNNSEEVWQLFLHLRKQIRAEEALAVEAFSRAVGPAGETDIEHLHHLKSYLMKALEDFLLWSHGLSDPCLRQQTLATLFRQRNLGKLSRRAHRQALDCHERSVGRGLDFFDKQLRLETENIRLSERENTAQTQDLQPLLDAQDLRFIVDKLQTACLLLSQQTVSPRRYETGLLGPLLHFLEGHRYLDVPAVALYYHGYRALSNPEDEAHFQRLKNLLHTHGPAFQGEELRNMYLLAVNFCIRRLNRQERGYLREVFELYQSGLEMGVFLENGQISRFTYINIAQAGMGLREFEWVAGFLENYKKYLPPGLREPVSRFSLARLFYETGRPAEAMQCLLQVEHDDVIHNLAAKTLLAKIYFEQQEFNALDSLLDSIEAYIRRKKLLGYHRNNYLGFVRMLRLLGATDLARAENRARVREKIAGLPVLAEREWLAGQVQ